MAEEPRACRHPKAKVIAEWVEPETVHQGSCRQWFHCEACGKYWREARRSPLPRGTRLSDAPVAHVVRDDTRLHLGWRPIVIVLALQSLVLIAMIWFLLSGAGH
ncbi:MAG: hypothetical protein ACREQM_18810 [Candidatus Dormibacteraceae bacterium]